jgi:cystathionine gamma-synthase
MYEAKGTMRRAFSKTGIGTKALWAGEDGEAVQGATQVPIVQSIAFDYDNLDDWQAVELGLKPGIIYSRNTNPTVAAFEEKVRIMEGAEAAASFSTGMAAISDTIFSFVRPADRIVSVKDTCGGTN